MLPGFPNLKALAQRVQHGLVEHVRLLRGLDKGLRFRNLLHKLRIRLLGRLNPGRVGIIRTVRRIRVATNTGEDYDCSNGGKYDSALLATFFAHVQNLLFFGHMLSLSTPCILPLSQIATYKCRHGLDPVRPTQDSPGCGARAQATGRSRGHVRFSFSRLFHFLGFSSIFYISVTFMFL